MANKIIITNSNGKKFDLLIDGQTSFYKVQAGDSIDIKELLSKLSIKIINDNDVELIFPDNNVIVLENLAQLIQDNINNKNLETIISFENEPNGNLFELSYSINDFADLISIIEQTSSSEEDNTSVTSTNVVDSIYYGEDTTLVLNKEESIVLTKEENDVDEHTAVFTTDKLSQIDSTFAGDLEASLVEDTNTSFTGKINIDDNNAADLFFQANTIQNEYGQFTLDINGNWTYTLDKEKTQSLNKDELIKEEIEVLSVDGTKVSINIDIVGTNDTPIINLESQNILLEESISSNTVVATVSSSDVDDDAFLTYSVNSSLVKVDSNGVVTLTPAGVEYINTDENTDVNSISFTVIVTDNHGSQSSINIDVDVNRVNENAPSFDTAAGSSVTEGEVSVGDTVATFTTSDLDDVNGDITYSIKSGNENGYFEINSSTGEVTLSQAGVDGINSDAGADITKLQLEVRAEDGAGNSTDSGLVDVDVTRTDDATVTVIDNVSVNEDTTLNGNVLSNDSDVDSTLSVSSFKIVGSDTLYMSGSTLSIEDKGSLKINSDGSFEFTPSDNFNGEMPSIEYTTNTGATERLNITVDSVNDFVENLVDTDSTSNVISENAAYGTYTGITLKATDVDGDAISYSINNDLPFKILEDGKIVVDGAVDYESNASFVFNVTATSADGSTTIESMTINVNDISGNLTGSNSDDVMDTITGTDSNDSLTGSNEEEIINAGAGNDNIYANAGDDIISGGEGRNSINAGLGDDTINITEGDGRNNYDLVRGGDGNDTVVFQGNRSDYVIDHDDARGRFTVTNKDTNEIQYIYDDVENYQFADKTMFTSDTDFSNDVIVDSGLHLSLGTGDDRVTLDESSTSYQVIRGGEGNDTVIFLGNRDDYVINHEESNGRYTVRNVDTNEVNYIYEDVENYQFADRTISPTDSDFDNDTVTGTDRHISSGSGDDTITLNESNTAYQVVRGGEGNDTVIFSGNRDDYAINHEESNGRYTVRNIETNEVNYIYEDVENYQFADKTVSPTDSNFDDDNVTGTSGNNSITTGSGTDVVNAGAGNDTINTGSGNDTIIGGEGRNTIYAKEGDDTITITEGDGRNNYEQVWGGDGNDTVIFSGNRDDYIIDHETSGGGRYTVTNIQTNEIQYIYEDVENYQFADKTISPTDSDFANDNISAGTDTHVYAGTGDDIINVTEGKGTTNQYIKGDEGSDTVVFSGNRDDYIINHEENNGRYTVKNVETNEITYVYDVESYQFADKTISPSDADFDHDNITGTNENNSLNAGTGDDTIVGGQGRNYIYGKEGDDTITITEGDGRTNYEQVWGGDGVDTVVFAGNRDDYIIDHQDSGGGRYTVTNIQTNEIQYIYDDVENYQFADKTISPSDSDFANDNIIGREGNYNVYAGTGDDVITGGTGRKTINADEGDDRINITEGDGTSNYEIVRGGEGTDTVVFTGNRENYTVTHEEGNGRFKIINIETSEAQYIYEDVEKIEFNDITLDTKKSDGSINETLTNDAPLLTVEESKVVDEDGVTTITYSTRDMEGSDVTVTATASNGTVVVNDNGTITYTPNENYNGADNIVVTATDLSGLTSTKSSDISISAVNDGPIALDDTSTIESVSLGDFKNGLVGQDGATGSGFIMLSSQDIQDRFPNAYSSAADNLIVVKNIDGKWFYDTNTSYVEFTPSSDDRLLAEVDFSNDTVTELSGITDASYQINGINAGYIDGDFTVTANKWAGSNNAGEFGVSGTSINIQSGISTSEDTSVNIEPSLLLSNDTDVDGDTLTIQSVQNPTNGTVELVDGKVVFTPEANYNGPASFTYTVSDGNGGLSTASASLNVTSVNDVPTIEIQSTASVNEDGTLTIDSSSFTVSDIEDGTLTPTFTANNGTVSLDSNGNIVYTPNENYNGSDTITVSVTDTNGATTTKDIAITVDAVNDGPVASDDTQTAIYLDGENTSNYLEIDNAQSMLGGASSLDISISLKADATLDNSNVSLFSYASSSHNNELLLFVNNSGQTVLYFGANSKVISNENILDGENHDIQLTWDSASGETKFFVDGVEEFSGIYGQGHTLSNNNATLNLGQEQDSVGGGFASNQAFKGEYSSVKVSANGEVKANWEMDSIQDGKVKDASGNGNDLLVNGEVSIVSSSSAISEDTVTVFNVLSNDADVDGDNLTITSVQSQVMLEGVAVGTAEIVTIDGKQQIKFTPNDELDKLSEGETKNLSFSYTISDGTSSDTANVSFTVNGENDASVASDDIVNTNENEPYTFTINDFEYTDVEGDSMAGVQITSLPTNGTLTLNGNPVSVGDEIRANNIESGKLVFTPSSGDTSNTSINFKVHDGNDWSNEATTSIKVTAMMDDPYDVNSSQTEFTVVNKSNGIEGVSLSGEMNFNSGSGTSGTAGTSTSGVVGDSGTFNGRGGEELSNLDLNTSNGDANTITMWFKHTNTGGWDMLAGSKNFDLSFHGNKLGFNTFCSDLYGIDATEFNDGEWHQIVAVMVNGDIHSNKIYIDGENQTLSQQLGLTNSADSKNITNDGSTITIGNETREYNGYSFNGQMDEVKVYKGALGPDDVKDLYETEKAGNAFTLDDEKVIEGMDNSLVKDSSEMDHDITMSSQNDTFMMTNDSKDNDFSTISKVDFGDGIDTLIIEDDIIMDFDTMADDAMKNLEVINMQNGSGDNALNNLKASDVLAMTDDNNVLKILGDNADSIGLKDGNSANDNWIKKDEKVVSDDGETFDVWTNNDVTVYIDEDVTVTDI